MTTPSSAPGASTTANRPAVSAEEFRGRFDRLRRWGGGVGTPRLGEVVSLSLAWDRTGGARAPRFLADRTVLDHPPLSRRVRA